MKILYKQYPPNYEKIASVFDIRGKNNIVFTYGNCLYVPSGVPPDMPLLKHEETHARQQSKIGRDIWWDKYLTDTEFRFAQELEAYRNQYKAMFNLTKFQRRQYLDHIASDLSGVIYGNITTKEAALELITMGIELPAKNPVILGDSTASARAKKKKQRQNKRKARR